MKLFIVGFILIFLGVAFSILTKIFTPFNPLVGLGVGIGLIAIGGGFQFAAFYTAHLEMKNTQNNFQRQVNLGAYSNAKGKQNNG